MSEEPSATGAVPRRVTLFDEVPWIEQKEGLRGKRLADGAGGFWLQLVEMAPGYEVTPHHHSADEIIIVLEGGCEFGEDRLVLGPRDSAVLAARHDYGFTVGDEGMTFLILRRDAATNSRASEARAAEA